MSIDPTNYAQVIDALADHGHVGIKKLGHAYRVVLQPYGKDAKDAIVAYSADPAYGGPLIAVLREVLEQIQPSSDARAMEKEVGR